MFTEDELEALIFGARIVQNWSDSEMARSADAAVGKIEAVVPAHLRHLMDEVSLWSPANKRQAPLEFDLAWLRAAIRARRKVRFRYRDEKGAETRRTIHPLILCFYGPFWLAGAWCELRNDFRFFQLDRMREVEFLEDTFAPECGRTARDLLRRELDRE
jgi:predicted DNA-binding transcriptional regulator YafY